MASFVAIDFETADPQHDSACAVGLVRVENGKIVSKQHHLLKPPRSTFFFTYIHGITWEAVRYQPSFMETWPKIEPLFKGVDFLAAHNAPFDRSVLHTCCRAANLEAPAQPFLCTVRLARKVWGLRPANLPSVCRHLKISLDHHQALSDAEACARIVLAAEQAGAALHP